MPCGTLWFQRLLVHTPATPRAINGRPLPVGVRSLFSGPPTVLATDLLKLDSRSPRRAGFHGPGMKGRCFVAARPHCERPTKEMLCRTPLFQRSGTDSRSACGLGTKKRYWGSVPGRDFSISFFMVLRVPCAGEQPRERSCLHTASLSWGGRSK